MGKGSDGVSMRRRPPLKADKGSTDRTVTMQECATHSTPRDCWLVIDGAAYDVSRFAQRHPGGDMIFVKAGRDCSQLFHSYHMDSAKAAKALAKLRIGSVSDFDASQGGEVVVYEDDGGFYEEIKASVAAKFAEEGKTPRWHPFMPIKTAVILSGVAVSAYFAFYGLASLALSMLAAVSLGFWRAEVGMSVQHDANHGAYTSNSFIGKAAGLTLDMVGASSWVWKQVHVNGHHAYTNVTTMDPDTFVDDAGDVRRVAQSQAHHAWYKWQHLYLPVLYGALSLKSVFGDFAYYFSREFGATLKFTAPTASEAVSFWALKAASLSWMLFLPLCLSHHGLVRVLCLFLVEQWTCGLVLAYLFQVAHVSEGVAWPSVDKGRVTTHGWAQAQVATTVNFAPQSAFWMQISGGLNYQIEHHLFPGMCHLHYPSIAPLVEAACKRHGVPYKSHATFGEALAAHWRWMAEMGAASGGVPTLGDF